jgi:hypothetical protein
MVALYNASVNLNHNIAIVKSKLEAIGAESISTNNKIITMLSGDELAKVAAERGLVAESKPRYLHVDKKWPIASQL